jgi:hypothetical protein
MTYDITQNINTYAHVNAHHAMYYYMNTLRTYLTLLILSTKYVQTHIILMK